MALTPAQRSFARKMAAASAASPARAQHRDGRAPAPRRGDAEANAYSLERARLGLDLRRLKEIQSIEAKIELKRTLIPEYADWVKGVLAADTGAEDDILAQVMVWLIDTGEFHDGLDLAKYMLDHGLQLPERFKRTLGCFLVEEIAEASTKARTLGEPFESDALHRVAELCADQDMPDEVRAKLAKEIGYDFVAAAEQIDPAADGPAGARKAGIQRGLESLRRAYGLSHKVGVKKDIDRLERELRKIETEDAAE